MFEKWRIKEHMDVSDAGGRHIGTVDSVDGDMIKLTRSDSSDGRHHLLDFETVDRIEDDRVYLKEGVPLPEDFHHAGSPTGGVTPNYDGDAAADAGYAGHETSPAGSEAKTFGTSGLGTGMGGSGTI